MVCFKGLIASTWLLPVVYGAASHTLTLAPTTSTASSAQFTIPASADDGATLIANVDDPEAVNAQSVCPGYQASNVQGTAFGFTATLKLAGKPCNVYGTDVESLNFTVEYQAADRLNIQITPTHVDSSNASWYLLPDKLVPKPKASGSVPISRSDLILSWTNDPSFNFKVIRKVTGDVLFNTEGSVLVYENQFIEFVTSLPEDYNLYGLGERMQNLRLLNDTTLTTYAADMADPIDM